MLTLQNVHKQYQMGGEIVHALQGVNLQIDEGDFVAIMGPSGSGKSTLMNVLGLLDTPDSGSYKLNGKEVAHLTEDELALVRRDVIGFVFQQFYLLPRLNTLENVKLPLFYSKRHADSDKAGDLLDKVGLKSRQFHKPNELSGGQQQRVAIARALVNDPKIIFADEPTGNLDSVNEKEIINLLKELNRQGMTIILVTHEDEIGQQAKRLIRMRDGNIVSDERREEIALPPKSEEVTKIIEPLSHFSNLKAHFLQGLKTLAGNKIRTGLSMLGILIGVAAVVAMLALGRGAQEAIKQQLSSLGSNLLVLRPGASQVGGVSMDAGAVTRLTLEDATNLKDNISDIQEASPSVSGRSQVTFRDKNWSTQIQGTTPAYAHMRASEPQVGRFFTEEESSQRKRVALIGATIVREVFGNQDPIGEMIKLNRVNFQVIGILPEKGSTGWRDQDDVIVIPVTTAMKRLLGKDYVDSIDIEMKDGVDLESIQPEILKILFSRHSVPYSRQQDAFQIRNMADVQAAMAQSSETMSVLLACIATISLLVGGIGIMNIMLVSVTERTHEIGLRKAIGAQQKDILIQFLMEAIVMSLVGGLSGIVFGWSITKVLSLLSDWRTSISPISVFLSFFFSALIGVGFGLYPAKKASQLNPIDALRHQ